MKFFAFTGELTQQQTENTKKLVKALRSGQYEQITDYLRTDEGYCCLGVGSCILNVPSIRIDSASPPRYQFTYPIGEDDRTDSNVASHGWWKEQYGWDHSKFRVKNHHDTNLYQKGLVDLNDGGWSFCDIAALIETVILNKQDL